MVTPVCSKCKFLTNEPERFRKCPKVPIFHRDMCCSNENNVIKDHVSGDTYKPFCEEVNKHGECLEYYPTGLDVPAIAFFDTDNTVNVYGDTPIIITFDGSEPSKESTPVGVYDDEQKVYVYEEILEHSCTVKAACILEEVLSDVAEYNVVIPDVPVISFDKSSNTVTINSYNKVYYTTDGSEVTTDSPEYTEPFVIDHNVTVKCCSYARGTLSEVVSLECLSIEPPVIEFDPDTNTVSITSDDTILYSTDGSDIFDDADEYTAPFVIDHNTVVKAACLIDGELSPQSELECKVPVEPVISFNAQTKTVTITSDNPVLYTTDGSDVKKKDSEYTGPFKITETCTVKAKSIVDGRLSAQAESECNI